jgi:glycosyltransferase involved in cell wall biosynthesis
VESFRDLDTWLTSSGAHRSLTAAPSEEEIEAILTFRRRDEMSTHKSQLMGTALPEEQQHRTVTRIARKKILFVTHTREFGGLERHVLCMVRRLLGSEVQLSIFNLGPDLFTAHLDGDETAQVRVACKSEPMSFWDWFRVFRSAQLDVVVFSYGWIWAFPFGSIAAWLAGVRRRFSIQQLLTPPTPPVEGKSLRSVLRRTFGGRARRLAGLRLSALFFNKTICVSNTVRESVVRDYGFPANRTITIYNCVSVSKFVPSESVRATVRTRLGVGPCDFLLVCAARLSEIKRIDILLHAIARVSRDNLHCKCVIVGDGPLREQLWEQAREMGLSDHVFFEGFREDVRPYLQAGSAFVLTSRAEGLPLAVLEAMACGLPCIVTDVGGNSEAVLHNVNGLVVSPGSIDAVAGAISYLLTHPHECAQMSRMARVRACELFDTEKSMAEIERVILS